MSPVPDDAEKGELRREARTAWHRVSVAEAEVVALRTQRDEAVELLTKMLAIHGLAFDATVTSESYPGAAHEEAEEAWNDAVRAFLAKDTATQGAGE